MPENHNFLFTRLSPLVSRVYKNPGQIENSDVCSYITANTRAELVIKKIEAYLKKNPSASLTKLAMHVTGASFIKTGLFLFSDVSKQRATGGGKLS